MGEYRTYTLLVTDKDLKIKSMALPLSADIAFPDYSYIHDLRPDYIVTQHFCDTIYSLRSGKRLRAKYALQYSNKIDRSVLSAGTDRLMKHINENDSFYHLGAHVETDGYALFFIDSRKGRCGVYMNKKNGKMAGGRTQQVDPRHLPFITFPLTAYDNHFVLVMELYDYKQFAMEASDRLSAADIAKLNDYSSDDNPTLVMYRTDNL